jgi:hypothetical protein
MSYKFINTVALILLTLFGVVICSCSRVPPDKPIIKIGGITITDQQLDIKLKIEKCYRDDKKLPDRWMGLYKLIDEALMEESAKSIGVIITADMLLDESRRVDKETKAPELLAEVKAVCPEYQRYTDLYLKPELLNRLVHYQFQQDRTIQEVPLDKATDALKKAKDGQDLKTLGNYSVQEIDPEKKKSASNELTRYNMEMADPDKELINTVLDTLSPGQLYQSVREDRYGFYIIKLLEHKDKYYKYEMLTFKKKDFDRWFNETITDISKEIYQFDLIEQIINNVTSGPVVAFLKK